MRRDAPSSQSVLQVTCMQLNLHDCATTYLACPNAQRVLDLQSRGNRFTFRKPYFETVCLASRHPADVGGLTTCARREELVLRGHGLCIIIARRTADKQRIFAVRRTRSKG